MSEHVDQSVVTETGLTDGGTFNVNVNTGTADRVLVFVDDGTGATPASYDLDIEVAYNDVPNQTFMPRNSISGSTSTHFVYTEVAPFEWRLTFTNSSGAVADYRVRVISMEVD